MADETAVTTYDKKFCGAKKRQGEGTCTRPAGWGTDHVGEGACKLHGGANRITHGRFSKIKRIQLRHAIERHQADPDPLNILPELALCRALLEDYVNRFYEYRDALLAWHESYTAAGRPLEPRRMDALRRCVEEFEIVLSERNGGATDLHREDLDIAKMTVEFMASAHEQRKPRRVMDIADAQKLLAEIRQHVATIENIEAQNAVSRRDLFRIMGEMGRVVETLVEDPKVKEEIEKQWLSIRLA